MTIRRLALLLAIALLSSACYTENRNGRIWACDETYNTCVDTGVNVL